MIELSQEASDLSLRERLAAAVREEIDSVRMAAGMLPLAQERARKQREAEQPKREQYVSGDAMMAALRAVCGG